jgi:predicted MFS family arabinose efflux permease
MADTRVGGRNIYVLTCAQALGSAGPPVIISLGGMVGQLLAPAKTLATLPVSLYTIGVALSTIPMAMLMRRRGRRPDYFVGNFFGILGGLTAGAGIVAQNFLLFCLGTAMTGINGACVQSYRFAATDGAAPNMRARAIAMVMVGGLVAAVIGPQMVIWTRDAIPGIPFAGSFFGQAGLTLLALPILLMIRTPPVQSGAANQGRPLLEIAQNPRFITAVGTGVVSYGLMSFVMTSAPIAMVECGHTVGEAALGIQWHVLAMFGPSFFTGKLIERFGAERVTATGLFLIAVGAVVALSGLAVINFWATLVLLGIGWNFGFVGATTLVATCHRPEERNKVQGLNDFLVFGAVAIASLLSGGLVQSSGWTAIAWAILPIVAAAILLITLSSWHAQRQATT